MIADYVGTQILKIFLINTIKRKDNKMRYKYNDKIQESFVKRTLAEMNKDLTFEVFQNTATPDGVIDIKKVAEVLGCNKKDTIKLTMQMIKDRRLCILRTTTLFAGIRFADKYDIILRDPKLEYGDLRQMFKEYNKRIIK